jgi:hypothetical protein
MKTVAREALERRFEDAVATRLALGSADLWHDVILK